MSQFDDDEEDQGFFRKNSLLIGFVLLAAIGGGFAAFKLSSKSGGSAAKAPQIAMVKLVLPPMPPPPPPPPPPPAPPQQEKMIEQTPVEHEDKPDDKPPDSTPDLGTGLKGDGPPDGFGLSGSGNNGRVGGGSNNQQRSKWGWYANQVQTTIAQALQTDRRTRFAKFNRLPVAVVADPATGRVTGAHLTESTGDAALDEAIKNVLTGLQFKEPLPAGMPPRLVTRITARRPN